MPDRLENLETKVAEYCRTYRPPNLKRYCLGPVYDLFPERPEGSIECGTRWDDEWPNSRLPGVYAFLDSQGDLLYVGKASMGTTIGHRLGKYCKYNRNDKTCNIGGYLERFNDGECPRYVWTVGIPSETHFEAPALEEFLLKELHPKHNTHGNQGIPLAGAYCPAQRLP